MASTEAEFAARRCGDYDKGKMCGAFWSVKVLNCGADAIAKSAAKKRD